MLTDVRSSCDVVGSPNSSPLASVCTTMPGITHAEAAAGSSIAAAVAADAPRLFGAADFRKEVDLKAADAVAFCVRKSLATSDWNYRERQRAHNQTERKCQARS